MHSRLSRFGALLIALCASALITSPIVAAPCEPLGLSESELVAWRDSGFATKESDRAALELLSCLGNPDSFFRDKIAYEGLTSLLRNKEVAAATRREMIGQLTEMMAATDDAGFEAPFAALALSEVARTDRIEAFLNAGERDELVKTAASYLSAVEDYRGYIDGEGWRHGVAHGADLVLQLVLNPAVTVDQQELLLAAVATQITPANGHAYIHGESGRLARPVLYAALGGKLGSEYWAEWFAGLGSPAPLASWDQAYGSERGLAQLHNVRTFAQAVYVTAETSGEASLQPIAALASELLSELP